MMEKEDFPLPIMNLNFVKFIQFYLISNPLLG